MFPNDLSESAAKKNLTDHIRRAVVTEDITISDTSSDNAEGKNLEQKIACIRDIPLSSRRESEKTLKVIDNDVGRVLTFLAYLGSQVFDVRTQDAKVAVNT